MSKLINIDELIEKYEAASKAASEAENLYIEEELEDLLEVLNKVANNWRFISLSEVLSLRKLIAPHVGCLVDHEAIIMLLSKES